MLAAYQLTKHGQKGACPTCDSPGTWDLENDLGNPTKPNFSDSICFNRKTQNYECWYCWLK